jgi:5-methylcytosine-specific restriction endonuclease McrA
MPQKETYEKRINMPPPKDPEKYLIWEEKQRLSHIGKKASQSTLDKMSESHKGLIPWNKGIHSSELTKHKQSIALKNKPKPPRIKEHCENMSKSKMGEKNPMFGEHHTFEAHVKMHMAQLGNKKKLGYHFPMDVRIKMSEDKKGDKCSRWKGGISPTEKIIRRSFKYREWVKQVFERDNFICQKCKIRGGYLNAHHIKPFAKILEENDITTIEEAEQCAEFWDINNGITLCKKCHNKEHFKNKE